MMVDRSLKCFANGGSANLGIEGSKEIKLGQSLVTRDTHQLCRPMRCYGVRDLKDSRGENAVN